MYVCVVSVCGVSSVSVVMCCVCGICVVGMCMYGVCVVCVYTPWHECTVRELIVGVGPLLLSSWPQGLDL